MKITIAGKPLTLDGEPFKASDKPDAKDLTFSTIICEALQGTYADEMPPHPPISGEEKLRRWDIAERVYAAAKDSGFVELTAEEIATIKKCVEKGYNVPTCAQTWLLLEGKLKGHPQPDTEEKKPE